MPLKLYAHPDDYKTKKALIAAKFVGLDIEVPAEAAKGSQVGKLPVLETDQGCIFSSSAIARYIARMNRQVGLYGQNILEGGMIDSWVEFSTHELEVPLCTWVLPVMGVYAEVPEATKLAKEDVVKALTVLNNHLLHNTYMVGHTVTLADISICCALVDGLRLVMDEDFRKPFGNLLRWFDLCLAQPEFQAVLGAVQLCSGAAKAKGQPAKGEAPKKEKEQKEPAAKKEAAPKKEKEQKKEQEKKEPAAKKEPAPKKEAKGGKKDEEQKKDAAADPEKARKDLLKKVIKEGGKRGVEIEGAADMGGLQFFCTSVELPDGDVELLLESVKAMNAESDPNEEERKGGSGHVGKMVFSAGIEQLAVVAYVPSAKHGELSCEEWLKTTLALFGGEVLSSSADVCTGRVKTNSDKGIFPLKIREPMILEANNFLRKRGLFPEDDDDDDEMVFGDDDFPS